MNKKHMTTTKKMRNNQHAKKSKKVYLQHLGSVLNGRHFLSNTPQLILIFLSVYKKNV